MTADRLARLAPPAPTLPLALLRVGVAAILLVAPEPALALAVSARDPALWHHPEGLGWLGTWVPLTPLAVHAATAALRAGALLALVGLWTRAALAVTALAFAYAFGAAQLTSAVLHDMHLLWMLLVLLAAPAGDALSLDAWAAGRPLLGARASRRAGAALLWARALLGMVYFFPGLWKARAGVGAWVLGDNLRHQMWFKWFEAGGAVPWPRVDRVPWLLALGAGAVLALELAFPLLALSRRGRRAALAGGVAFHALAAHLLYVRFPSLVACYGALLGDAQNTPADDPHARTWPAHTVGAALALLVAAQGFRGQTQAWPFACYPTFHQRAPDRITDLALELVDDRGRALVVRDRRDRPQDAWGATWRAAGLYGDGAAPARLRAWGAALAARRGYGAALGRARRVRYVAEAWSVDPARYRDGPLARRVVLDDPR